MMSDRPGLEHLSEWLRAVELQPAGEREEALAEAALEIRDSLAGRGVLDLVLLAHGIPNESAHAAVLEAVQSRDATFAGRPTDLESQLAGAVAIAAMLASPNSAAVAAHGILSAEWLGLQPVIPDLPAIASRALREHAEEVRRRAPLSAVRGADKFFGGVSAYKDDDAAIYSQDARSIAGGAKKAASGLTQAVDRLAHEATIRHDATDEELDLLWWAFSAFSERAGKPWVALPSAGQAALLVGVELAHLLRFDPELPSTDALITRLLGDRAEEQITIEDTVEVSAEYLRDLDLPEGHQLLPLLSSVLEYVALEGKRGWRESVTRWAIESGTSHAAVSLARQAVREVLTARAS